MMLSSFKATNDPSELRGLPLRCGRSSTIELVMVYFAPSLVAIPAGLPAITCRKPSVVDHQRRIAVPAFEFSLLRGATQWACSDFVVRHAPFTDKRSHKSDDFAVFRVLDVGFQIRLGRELGMQHKVGHRFAGAAAAGKRMSTGSAHGNRQACTFGGDHENPRFFSICM